MNTSGFIPIGFGKEVPNVVGKGFGIRAGAFLLDLLIIPIINSFAGLLSGLVGLFLIVASHYLLGRDYGLASHSQLSTVIPILIQITMYFCVFEWLAGRTIGKMLLKIQVVNYDGNYCSLKQAFIRSLYRFIDGFFFGLIAFIKMKAPLYQRFGDIKASTLVVDSKNSIIKQSTNWKDFLLALLLYLLLSSLVVSVSSLADLYLKSQIIH